MPHGVIDLAPGDCVDCHMAGYKAGEGHVAAKIPRSHYLNNFTGEKTGEQPIGIRTNCLQCHVVQTASTPPYEK